MEKKGVVAIAATVMLVGFLAGAGRSQTLDDLVLYSLEDPTGSARAVGLGNALGAVGGEGIAMAGNPAGLGVYRGMEISVSGALGARTVRTRFVGNRGIARVLTPSFEGVSTIFSVRVGGEDHTKGLVRINFGIGYNRLQSFRFRQTYSGEVNDGNSLLAAIASEANARGLVGSRLLRDRNGYMPYDSQPWFPTAAYGSYLMLDGKAPVTFKVPWIVTSRGRVDEKLRQSAVVDSYGHLGELDLSMAFNAAERFYFGVTLGIQRFEREMQTVLKEETNEEKDAGLLSGKFTTYDRATGKGINVKFGAIYRPIDQLHLGLSFHSPTFVNVRTRFSMRADALYRNPDPSYGEPKFSDPVDSSGLYKGEYSYTSPLRAQAAIVYTFGKKGLVSAEYDVTCFPLMQFAGTDFTRDNEDIVRYLLPTHEVKLGTEWFFGRMGVRFGGGFRTSPYRSEEFSPRRWRLYVGAGFGYYGSFFFCDFAYRHTIQPGEGYMYNMGGYARAFDTRYYTAAGIVTLGFRF